MESTQQRHSMLKLDEHYKLQQLKSIYINLHIDLPVYLQNYRIFLIYDIHNLAS